VRVCAVPDTNMARGAALHIDHKLSETCDVSLTSPNCSEWMCWQWVSCVMLVTLNYHFVRAVGTALWIIRGLVHFGSLAPLTV
jgi:hypothetical protein